MPHVCVCVCTGVQRRKGSALATVETEGLAVGVLPVRVIRVVGSPLSFPLVLMRSSAPWACSIVLHMHQFLPRGSCNLGAFVYLRVWVCARANVCVRTHRQLLSHAVFWQLGMQRSFV